MAKAIVASTPELLAVMKAMIGKNGQVKADAMYGLAVLLDVTAELLEHAHCFDEETVEMMTRATALSISHQIACINGPDAFEATKKDVMEIYDTFRCSEDQSECKPAVAGSERMQ